VFYVLFMGQTIILAIVVGLIAMIWRRRTEASWAIAKYWRNSNVAFLRWIVGVDSDVTGAENIPPGACIIAAKHQSDWDIFAILPHTNDQPAYIAKKELIDIPFFGQAARSINTISIDRKLGAQAIPKMLEAAGEALSRGCRIVIYPEGTRKKPLADPDYRQGVTRMYEALNHLARNGAREIPAGDLSGAQRAGVFGQAAGGDRGRNKPAHRRGGECRNRASAQRRLAIAARQGGSTRWGLRRLAILHVDACCEAAHRCCVWGRFPLTFASSLF
jgi:1-acyl-sn-glycerol-3-phosphate acyltransferase